MWNPITNVWVSLVYAEWEHIIFEFEFENDVKTYGTQAHLCPAQQELRFENDVKTYGTQAIKKRRKPQWQFENDVKTYGTQAKKRKEFTE